MTADPEATAAEAPVLVERRGSLGVLVLNRPRALNALTHEMVGLLHSTLDEWATDPQITTVALTGAGDRALCAGGDLISIHRDAMSGGRGAEQFWRDEYRLNATIASYPTPIVVLMDGLVLGGGVGISAHASHRVVTERTRFGMPEVGIGFAPDVGGTWLLSRSPGELGTYVALTAGYLGAGDTVALGLADRYVPSEHLAGLLDLLVELPVDEALARVSHPTPPSPLTEHRSWIDPAFGHDDVGQIMAALSELDDEVAAQALASMRANSPTSLVVGLAALRASAGLTLEEALAQEYRISVRMLRGHDFPEGIRAQVIDKDRTPHWEPAEVADVTPDLAASYFETLGEDDFVLPPAAARVANQEGTA